MRPARVACVAGVTYVVLDVVVGVMAGAPPSPSASPAEIASYVADHRAGLGVGLWLFGLAAVALLWWFGEVYRRMVDAEAGRPRLAVVSLAGLVLGGVFPFASASALATLALVDDPQALVTLYTLAAVLLTTSGFGLGAHLLATNVLALQARLLATPLAVAGLIAATGFLVAGVLGAILNDATPSTVSLVGFVIWLLWILGVSARMWAGDAHDTGDRIEREALTFRPSPP